MLMPVADIGTTVAGTGRGWLLPALPVSCLALIAALAAAIVRQRRLAGRKGNSIPELTKIELIELMHLLKKMLCTCFLFMAAVPMAAREADAQNAENTSSWYVGLQGGVPFGTSTFSSFGADKTRAGFDAGLYGGYRFNPVLSLEAQAAWGRLTMNRRDCCPDYWMGTDGCRYEAAVAGMDGWYMSALRSRTFVQRYAAQLNVNLLGFFRATRDSRWSLDLSPHIAAIGTKSDFRLTDGKTDVLQGDARWHFGAGGNVQASYTFPVGLQLGIYTGMTYLTGKPMDGTPEHLHKANYTWETGLRLGWSFGAKGKGDGR